ncbi:hypothetical protein Vi05172_g13728 [Venturia inaequalis]|nr:hypothetical protein Vi05172_g13728 [Venturia inaequalis]
MVGPLTTPSPALGKEPEILGLARTRTPPYYLLFTRQYV